MYISNYPPLNAVNARNTSSRAAAGGGVFTLGEAPATARAQASGPAAAMANIGALLALQSVDDPLFAKRKAVRRGTSMLDALENIKADLLMGQVGEGRLNQLLAQLGQSREQTLPGLEAVLDDIELLVRVELAKLGQFPGA